MKTIIVTGARGLLGEYFCDCIDELNYLTNEKLGYNVIGVDIENGQDLTDESFVKEFFKVNKADALVNFFALNHHVHNGAKDFNQLMEISLDSFKKYLDINVTALFSVCREFARNNEIGSIVNFTSTYGVVSPDKRIYGELFEKHIGYGVSKAAVIQLTRHLATHLAPKIRVNCVMPGGVINGQGSEFIKRYIDKTPMGRMANPEDVSGLVLFLISDEAAYCTGGVYPVDGGYSAW